MSPVGSPTGLAGYTGPTAKTMMNRRKSRNNNPNMYLTKPTLKECPLVN